jgi:hypothetical protein
MQPYLTKQELCMHSYIYILVKNCMLLWEYTRNLNFIQGQIIKLKLCILEVIQIS